MKLALSTALVALLSVPALADDDLDVAPPGSVEPAPAPAAAPTPAPAAEYGCHHRWGRWHHGPYASRFAIGVGGGHYELADDVDEGHTKSLFARIGLHHGFEIELEMARTELDSGDNQRGGGAALVKTFGHRHFRPYVLAGFGGARVEPDAGADRHVHYGELGWGLMLRGRHLALALDMRHGVRKLDSDDDATAAARMTTPGEDEKQHTTRGRILALVYF